MWHLTRRLGSRRAKPAPPDTTDTLLERVFVTRFTRNYCRSKAGNTRCVSYGRLALTRRSMCEGSARIMCSLRRL